MKHEHPLCKGKQLLKLLTQHKNRQRFLYSLANVQIDRRLVGDFRWMYYLCKYGVMCSQTTEKARPYCVQLMLHHVASYYQELVHGLFTESKFLVATDMHGLYTVIL